MSGRIGQKLRANFQARMPTLPGRVTSVPLDASGRPVGYVLCDIGGNTVQVHVGLNDNVQPGDWLVTEQRGGAASAAYYAIGYTAGPRGDALLYELPTDITLGGVTYQQGDIVLGDPLSKHWWYRLSQAAWLLRDGALTQGAIGNLNGLYDYASVIYGTVFGRSTGSWLSIDETNGLRQFTNGVQRSHLRQDGSGWFVGADKLWWDTAGNLNLAAAINALRLHIGVEGGARLVGGEVVDFDIDGNPIVTPPRYGLRLYDSSGLPQIALLTGTVADPLTPALLVGADNATSYLRWLNGILELRGYAIIDGGQLGGYTVLDKRITSLNHKVILANAADGAFAEGLLLVSAAEADAGVIAWRKSTATGDEDDYEGLITTYHDGQTRLLIGCSNRKVTYVPGVSVPLAQIRLETNNPYSGGYGEKGYLDLQSTVVYDQANQVTLTQVTLDTNARLRVKSLAQLDGDLLPIANLNYDVWVGAGSFVFSTSQGTAGRLNSALTGVECVAGGYAMTFQVPTPDTLAAGLVNITEATIYYSTLIANAYISLTRVYVVNTVGTPAAEVLYEDATPQGQGATGPASYTIDTGWPMSVSGPIYIHFELTGVTDYGHVVIYGVRLRGITI